MPETIPQIAPQPIQLRLETRPESSRPDTGALIAGADGSQRPHRLVDRAGCTIRDTPSSIKLSAVAIRLQDLDSCCWIQGWRDAVSTPDRLQSGSRACGWRARPVGASAALDEGHGLASQPTLSRLLDTLSREESTFRVLLQAVTELACRRIEINLPDRSGPAAKTGGTDSPRKKWYAEKTIVSVPRGRSPGGCPWASPGRASTSRYIGYYSPVGCTTGSGGPRCRRDGGPDRSGRFRSGGQLPGEAGAEVDAPGGGPLSGASVRLDDRADGCGVPGAGTAGGRL